MLNNNHSLTETSHEPRKHTKGYFIDQNEHTVQAFQCPAFKNCLNINVIFFCIFLVVFDGLKSILREFNVTDM